MVPYCNSRLIIYNNLPLDLQIAVNKKLDTPTKSYIKESMKGSYYEQDGLPHER